MATKLSELAFDAIKGVLPVPEGQSQDLRQALAFLDDSKPNEGAIQTEDSVALIKAVQSLGLHIDGVAKAITDSKKQ